jgi:pantoate--beta-alanine ligase
MPEFVESIATLRQRLLGLRGNRNIGLVPTMGALHGGHARLIEEARRECGAVVVSIFVNPTQFDRKEDLQSYPRTLPSDVDLCARLGVDVVFAPTAKEMYPHPLRCTVEVSHLADHLCGRYRPGHFQAVATIVLKLVEIVRPDRAYFGEKDAQQLAIVRRLVADFNVPVAIVGVPTVREPDGLALSSRNQHLTPEERPLAVSLFQSLGEAARQIGLGQRDAGRVKSAARSKIPESERLRLEYLEIVDPNELQPVDLITEPVLVAGALWVGSTRLIDNVLCQPLGPLSA